LDRTVTIRNLGQDRQDTRDRIQYGQNMIAKTGQGTEEHGQDRQDSQNRKAGTGQQKRQSGQHRQDKKERLAQIYQLRQDNWDMKTMTGKPWQESQDDSRDRTARQDN
jgi:hypothetical protein